MIKLNLGCGRRPLDGWINVDKYPPADLLHDLEDLPWPWPDNAADEVFLCHVLEHLGHAPSLFLKIMQELYRVCANGALVTIIVPDPRHDHYLHDPTHVRPITPQMLELFSKNQCEIRLKENNANTPLALQLGVDFELAGTSGVPDARFEGKDNKEITEAYRRENNVISEITVLMRAVK